MENMDFHTFNKAAIDLMKYQVKLNRLKIK